MPTTVAEDTNHRMVEREAARFKGKCIAFVAILSNEPNSPYEIGVAVLGQAGYTLPLYRDLWANYEWASDHAAELNKILGHDEATAIAIIADTMHRSQTNRKEKELAERLAANVYSFTVRVEAEHYLGEVERQRVADRLAEMVSEEGNLYDIPVVTAWADSAD